MGGWGMIRLSTFALAVLLPAGILDLAQAESRSGAPSVIVKGGGLWPVLVDRGGGKLAMIVFNQPAHGSVPGDVACYGSDNHGKTWFPKGIAGPRPNPDGASWNAALGVGENGDLVALVNGKTAAADRMTMVATRVMRSGDGGSTWVQTSSMADPPQGGFLHFPFGRIYRASDGTLRTFTYSGQHRAAADWIVTMLTSKDDGRTFADPMPVCRNGNEVAACEISKGQWLLAVRTGTRSRLKQYRSTDDGRTWQEEGDVTEALEIPGDLVSLADGRLFLVYGDRKGEQGIRMKLSFDRGLTWSKSEVLVTLGHRDCGYPSAVQLENGRVLIAYYSKTADYHDGYHTGIVEWDP
jgi:hypothetical protein